MATAEKSLHYGDYTDQHGFEYRAADGVNYNQLLALYLGWLIKAIKRYEALTGVTHTYDTHELKGWAELERLYKTKGNWGYSFHDVYHNMFGQSVIETQKPEDFAIGLKDREAEMCAEWKMDLCDVEFLIRFQEIVDMIESETEDN